MPIKIQKKAKTEQQALPLAEGLRWISLSAYLSDTLVARVGISADALSSINSLVERSLAVKPVHETGGFLLGSFQLMEAGHWDLGVTQFCPAKAISFSSPNRLAFGTGALQELDAAMDAAPELSLLGWFHTHPGHTPYLSIMDLSIHDGFFLQPWQIAIVLDPLTPGSDTGIFSRQSSGQMNNKLHYTGKWIPWSTL